jgi:integrase
LAAISGAHRCLWDQNPCASELVRLVLRGIMRVHGTAQQGVRPLCIEDLVRISAGMGSDLRAIRGRALLQIGFAGAFRRSELIGINCKNLEWGADGLNITIQRSKSDPYARGRVVRVQPELGPLKPIDSLKDWLTISEITDGPVFRPVSGSGRVLDRRLTAGSVPTILKQRIAVMGYDPTEFAGHSLRAGFVTAAAYSGMPIWRIVRQTGHRSIDIVSRYIRPVHPL